MSTKRSEAIFERAQGVIPGGVNSPVRACRSVGGDPVFVAQGDGATITAATSPAFSATSTASRSLYGTTIVSFAAPSGTPAEPGMPSVAAPEPAATSRQSE